MSTPVTLEPVTRTNYRAVCSIATEPGDERVVAANSYSLTQAAYEPGCEPFAIVADGAMVGFIMFERDPQGCQWVLRLMIASGRRRMGYGRAAMEAALARYRARGIEGMFVSFVPENRPARSLYASLGFEDTGKVEDGELVYYCRL